MTKPNERCPCGSGKKFKRCCMGQKPKSRAVTVDMGRPVPVDAVSFNKNTGEVVFFHKGSIVTPLQASSEITYPRKKGPKVLTKAPLSAERLLADPSQSIEQYDRLFAIDTNTKKSNDCLISITCIVIGIPEKINLVGHTAIRIGPRHCLEFWNANENPEHIGWCESILGIRRSPEYSENKNIGLVVDCDLGRLGKINEMKEPILRDFYLPENFKLIYASADTGKDNVLNFMISLADKEATKLLKYIIESGYDRNLKRVENKPFEMFRFWTI